MALRNHSSTDDAPAGTVMRQGYKLGDQVLRHAMVGVVDSVEAADTIENPGDAGDEHAESNE